MCAIFGISGFREEGLLEKMGAALRHRGPDDQGTLSNGAFQMGMCRLSILDLDGGQQPVYSADHQYAICYNGEVYNYLELRAELARRGYVFKTNSDTEVVLNAYLEWGEKGFEKLNGMFAFAIHSLRSGETIFARDRSGQKPFYYWHQGKEFIFASEIKAILKSGRVERKMNLEVLDAYLALRYVPEPATLFTGIYTLPSGCFMRRSAEGEITIQRYWDVAIHKKPSHVRDEVLVDELEEIFRDAIKICLRSDVPVGAYLSAGVDSSLVVSMMTEFHSDVRTYSIGFGSEIDETRDAAETARLLGTKHHEIHCLPEDFRNLRRVVHQMDRPVGDALILAFDKLAAVTSKDLKVVLSGEGADEIFGGYSFHKLLVLMEKYFRHMPDWLHRYGVMPAFRATPLAAIEPFFQFPADLGKEGKQRLEEFLGGYRGRTLFDNYIQLKTLWPAHLRSALYTEATSKATGRDWLPVERNPSGGFLDRLLRLQWQEWLQDWCLIRQDKNTMAHSLEVRLPFLDNRLIDFGFSLPDRLRTTARKDKIIERKLAARRLPPAVTNRPKNPFFFPLEFFHENAEFKNLIEETLSEEVVKKRGLFKPDAIKSVLHRMQSREFLPLKQVMSLVILELWQQEVLD